MHILHVVQGYTPAIGGTELAIQKISERLVERHGDRVTVFTTVGYNCEVFWRRDQPTLPVGTSVINGVTVRRFPVVNRLNGLRLFMAGATYKLHMPFSDYFRALYNGPIIPALPGAIARSGADIVAASSFPLLHMHYALYGAHRGRMPVVLIGGIHVTDKWGFDRPMIYKAIRQAERAVAYTSFERDFLLTRGVAPNHVAVIGLGVDPDAFQHATGREIRQAHAWGTDPVVAYIGQQVAHKGIDTLLEAMQKVWARCPTARLLIAGSRTSFTQALERLVGALPAGMRERVTFVHNFPESAKPGLFAACDVFAYPSAYESFGLTILEAWSARRPVVACGDGAPGSIVEHGVDGLLVRYHDADDLAAAIGRLLCTPDLRAKMGEAGRRKVVSRYSWNAVADQFRSLYVDVCERTGPAARLS